jgi:hypothetical protein
VSDEYLPYSMSLRFALIGENLKSGQAVFRLVQQAVDTGPTTYAHIAKPSSCPVANHNL